MADEIKIPEHIEVDGIKIPLKDLHNQLLEPGYNEEANDATDKLLKSMTIGAMAPGAIEGAGVGALDIGSLGFRDEAAAAAKTGAVSGPEYEKERDLQRAYSKQMATEHPFAYPVGGAAGLAATSLVGGELLAPVTTLAGGAELGTLGRIGAGLADNAIIGGVAGAGMAEGDKLEGAMEGAKPGLIPTALTVGLGAAPALFNKSAELLKNTQLGKDFGTGGQIFNETGHIVGNEAANKVYQKQLEEAGRGIAEGQIIPSLEGAKIPAAKAEIQDVANSIEELIKGTKSQEGKKIRQVLDSVVAKGDPINARPQIQSLIDKLKGARFGGDAKTKAQDIIGELQTFLQKEEAAPIVTQSKNKSAINLGGEEAPLSRSQSIQGKDVSLDQLQEFERLLKESGYQPQPAGASQTFTQNSPEQLLKQVSEKQSFARPPEQIESIDPEKLLELRNYLGEETARRQPDEQIKGLVKGGYGDVNELLKAQTASPEERALLEGANKKYSTALSAQEQALTEGKIDPAVLDLLQRSHKTDLPLSKEAKAQDLYNLLKELNPEYGQAIQTQGQESAEKLAGLQQTLRESTQGAFPTETGTTAYPAIEEGILGLSSAAKKGEEKRRLLGAVNVAGKETPQALEQRLAPLAEKARVSGLGVSAPAPINMTTNPKALATRLVGQSPSVYSARLGGFQAKAAKNIGDFLQRVKNDPSIVNQLAQKGYRGLSTVLSGLAGKDNIARNATVYMISQDPKLRKEWEDFQGSENPEIPGVEQAPEEAPEETSSEE